MQATIDAAGRILLPKQLRDALGLVPGMRVDIADRGGVVQITPGGRTARIERNVAGRPVAVSETAISDADVFALIDAGRI